MCVLRTAQRIAESRACAGGGAQGAVSVLRGTRAKAMVGRKAMRVEREPRSRGARKKGPGRRSRRELAVLEESHIRAKSVDSHVGGVGRRAERRNCQLSGGASFWFVGLSAAPRPGRLRRPRPVTDRAGPASGDAPLAVRAPGGEMQRIQPRAAVVGYQRASVRWAGAWKSAAV